MIAFTDVPIGAEGLVRCNRCRRPGGGEAFALSAIQVELQRIADSWTPGLPGPNVAFTGYEPFNHPGLPSVVNAATSLGFERIRLRTDGGALAQQDNAAGAYAAGVRHLEVVVLGDPATHDALAGCPGLSDAARAGAQAFVSQGPVFATFVSGYIPVCRHNARHLAEAVLAVAALGGQAVTLDMTEFAQGPGDEALLSAALETATVNRIAVGLLGGPERLLAPSRRLPWDTVGGVAS